MAKVLILLMVLLMASCAPTSKNMFSSTIENSNISAIEDKSAMPLVVIRYPVAFDASAMQRASGSWDEFIVNINGKRTASEEELKQKTKPVAALMYDNPAAVSMAKTHYFALEFYKQLKTKIPPSRILLEPVVVSIKDGKYVLSGSQPLPSLLLIDFCVASGKDLRENTTSQGNMINAFVSVRTDTNIAPKTQGVLLDVFHKKSNFDKSVVSNESNAYFANALGRDIADLLNNNGKYLSGNEFPISTKFPPDLGGYFFENNLRFDGFNSANYNGLVNLVVGLTNNSDIKSRSNVQLAKYVQDFDEKLAVDMMAGDLSELDGKKVEFLKLCLGKEKEFQARRNDIIMDTFFKEYGDQLRKMAVEEDKILTQYYAQQRAQVAMVLGAIAAGAAGTFSAINNGPSALTASSFAVMGSMLSLAAVNQAEFNGMLANFDPYSSTLEEAQSVSLDWESKEETFNVKSFAEIRKNFKLRYTSLFGSPKA